MSTKTLKIIGYSLVIVLFSYLIITTDFKEILNQIQNVKIEIIILLIILQLLTQILLCVQWYKISTSILGSCSFLKMFYILSTGSVVEAITPGAKIGGEVTRLYYLKKELNAPTDKATNIIIIQKSISMSVLMMICVTSFIYLTTKIHFSLITQIIVDAISVVFILFLVFLLFFSDKLVKILEKTKKFTKTTKWVKSYADSTSLITTKHWFIQLSISIAVWILFPLKMAILARSMDLQIHMLVIIAITMTSYMIGMLPITPGGIGTFEGTMIALLALISIENNVAITLAVVFRIITFWFVMLFSTAFVLLYKRRKNEN